MTRWFGFLVLLMPIMAWSQSIRFSVIRTGMAETREGLVFQGGSFFKKVTLNHSAILIEHGDQLVLFDTGLGTQIKQQYAEDMPYMLRPLFAFEPLQPAISQLTERDHKRITKTFLSHVHWDHASGLRDFPDACVAISHEEEFELKNVIKNATFPSQFSHPEIKWCPYAWSSTPYKTFEKSFDLFGDGSAVIVPLPGHTTGSVGLFLRTSDKEYFFVGDLVWNRKGLLQGKGKFWLASWIIDRNRTQTAETIQKVRDLAQSDSNLIIVPAHDSEAQDELGYYPKWVEGAKP